MRTKHIDTCFPFICEIINNDILSISYCPTDEMIVEIILLRIKRRKAYVTKNNLDACLIVIGHRLDTDELYNICHPNMYMKHGL